MPMDKHKYDNVLVIVDRLSKMISSLPCKKTATAEDAAVLFYTHVWGVFGHPETVTSDRGPRFISAF